MTTPTSRALHELQRAHGIAPDFVLRADLARDGSVSLETEVDGRRRWFTHGAELSEVMPAGDRRLPLCAALDLDGEGVRVLSWRPGRRIALRLETAEGFEVLKGVRRKRLEKIHAAYSRVHDALTSPDDFIVPSVLAATDLQALRMQGLELDPIGLSQRSEPAYRLVGRALANFQRRVPSEGLARHGFVEELAILDDIADRHVRGTGDLPTGWRGLRDRLDDLAPPLELGFVAAHRDLHDGQILTDGKRVGLIDFDLLTSASPLLDLANLSAHLMLRALQSSEDGMQRIAVDCGHALLEGYGIGEGAALQAELRAYQTATFLRLALVYSMRPAWCALPEPLIRLGLRCLDDQRPD